MIYRFNDPVTAISAIGGVLSGGSSLLGAFSQKGSGPSAKKLERREEEAAQQERAKRRALLQSREGRDDALALGAGAGGPQPNRRTLLGA